MKNNNIQINENEQEISNIPKNTNINNGIDINNMNKNDIQNIKKSLNKLRNICNTLKEKNAIIDGMLLSTKKEKKILSQETLKKENELIEIENEINIYYNKLFSDYIYNDNNKKKILSKLKLIKEELTQKKYIDYLNKKIIVEQKEEKIEKALSKLSTEQLEVFNNEIYNNIKNNKDQANAEIMNKYYEDIKKSDIYTKIFSEIKEALYNEKYHNSQSMSSFYNTKNNKLNKKFNSRIITESSNYFQPYSNGNSTMRSEIFSNRKKKMRLNHSMDMKHNMNNDFKDEDSNNIKTKYYLDTNNIRNNSFVVIVFESSS